MAARPALCVAVRKTGGGIIVSIFMVMKRGRAGICLASIFDVSNACSSSAATTPHAGERFILTPSPTINVELTTDRARARRSLRAFSSRPLAQLRLRH